MPRKGNSRVNVAKAAQKQYDKFKMMTTNMLPYSSRVSIRARGGIRGGYLNTMNRQARKVAQQLKAVPGCGPKTIDLLPDELI